MTRLELCTHYPHLRNIYAEVDDVEFTNEIGFLSRKGHRVTFYSAFPHGWKNYPINESFGSMCITLSVTLENQEEGLIVSFDFSESERNDLESRRNEELYLYALLCIQESRNSTEIVGVSRSFLSFPARFPQALIESEAQEQRRQHGLLPRSSF